jgi:hypothetical protein
LTGSRATIEKVDKCGLTLDARINRLPYYLNLRQYLLNNLR